MDNVVLVGIRRRGEPIARMIQQNIEKIEGVTVPCGSIDIGFYRDDLTTITESPLVRRAELDFDVTAKDVVLTDDVVHRAHGARRDRGRVLLRPPAQHTVRGAGGPRARELPIRADYVGKNIPTSRSELVEVRLPEYDGETGVFLMEL